MVVPGHGPSWLDHDGARSPGSVDVASFAALMGGSAAQRPGLPQRHSSSISAASTWSGGGRNANAHEHAMSAAAAAGSVTDDSSISRTPSKNSVSGMSDTGFTTPGSSTYGSTIGGSAAAGTPASTALVQSPTAPGPRHLGFGLASGAFGSAQRFLLKRKPKLTDYDRKQMCLYHQANPGCRQDVIAKMYGIDRTTVSKVLRHSDKYLSMEDPPEIVAARQADTAARAGNGGGAGAGLAPAMAPLGGDIERTVVVWAVNTVNRGGRVTEAMLCEKMSELALALGTKQPRFYLADDWLARFKEQHPGLVSDSAGAPGAVGMRTPSTESSSDIHMSGPGAWMDGTAGDAEKTPSQSILTPGILDKEHSQPASALFSTSSRFQKMLSASDSSRLAQPAALPTSTHHHYQQATQDGKGHYGAFPATRSNTMALSQRLESPRRMYARSGSSASLASGMTMESWPAPQMHPGASPGTARTKDSPPLTATSSWSTSSTAAAAPTTTGSKRDSSGGVRSSRQNRHRMTLSHSGFDLRDMNDGASSCVASSALATPLSAEFDKTAYFTRQRQQLPSSAQQQQLGLTPQHQLPSPGRLSQAGPSADDVTYALEIVMQFLRQQPVGTVDVEDYMTSKSRPVWIPAKS